MTLGSLFDGIGGWLLAARHAGITPVWASEIEPFPCSVTARHFPEVKQLGDITKLDGDPARGHHLCRKSVSGLIHRGQEGGIGWCKKRFIPQSS